jgi:membrane protein DedA with SNARE-associated domain
MIEHTIFNWIAHYGYPGLFSLLMLGIVGLPIPDETLLAFAGYLINKGDLEMVPTVAVAFLGTICGITVSYGVGRTGGSFLVEKYGRTLHLTPDRITRVHDWLFRTGRWGLTVGYFVPGIRHLTALVAGTTKLRYPVFALFAYMGGFIWSITFITIGYYFGREWLQTSAKVHLILLIGAGIGILLAALYYCFHRILQRRR